MPAEPAGGLYGRTVVSIAYTSDGDAEADSKEIGRLVAIRVGEPLTEDATGATIRSLPLHPHKVLAAIEQEKAGGTN